MRSLLVVLAAGVTAGLVAFFAFNVFDAFRLMGGDVLVRTDVFVAFIACLAIGASAMALVYRGLLMRSEQAALRGLQDRVARLETGQAS